MVADGYKDTEIGVIPVEWDVVNLNDLGKVITGSTPKTSNQDFYINGTRLWASPSDLGKSKEIKTTNTKLSDLGFEQIRVLEKRSILITCIGSTIGKMGIAYEEMSSNQQINAITCNEYNNPDFYYYVLLKIQDKIKKLAGTQAVPLLNKTDFSKIKVIQPPLKEQEKIADILSTADDKIDAIASQIEKAETLKKGLLQKLLSEGIGHSEFKDSELGKIPESWEVVELEKGCNKIIGGGTPSKNNSSYWNNGTILWATPTEFTKSNNRYISTTTLKITQEGLENSSATLLSQGTVIMSSRATIGECKINTIEMTTNQGFISYECNEILNNLFLLYLIGHYKDRIIKVSSGSTFLEVSRTTMRNFKIPLPPLEEQKQIAEILSTADEKLEVLRAKKEKYETLKKGLLQKLLSGEVRV